MIGFLFACGASMHGQPLDPAWRALPGVEGAGDRVFVTGGSVVATSLGGGARAWRDGQRWLDVPDTGVVPGRPVVQGERLYLGVGTATTAGFVLRDLPLPGPVSRAGAEWSGETLVAWTREGRFVAVDDAGSRTLGDVGGRIDGAWAMADRALVLGPMLVEVPGGRSVPGLVGTTLAISGGGGRLLTVDAGGAVLWNLDDLSRTDARSQWARHGAMSEDGRRVVVLSGDGATATVWCIEGGRFGDSPWTISLPDEATTVAVDGDRLVAAFLRGDRVRERAIARCPS